MIKCVRCNKEFKFNYLLVRHNNRKFPCKEVENNSHQLTPINTNLHQLTPINLNDKKEDKNNILQCIYCKKHMRFNHLTRHQRNTCSKIPKEEKDYLIEKYNNHKKSSKKLVVVDKQTNNTNINTINTNSNNTTNNNTLINTTNNNNITIKINPFGKENIEKITEKQILEILNKAYAGFPYILKQLHFDVKENRNIYQPNLNKPFIKYFNGNRWQSNKFDLICQRMFTNVSNILEDWLEEHQTKVHEKKKEILNKFINDCNGGKTENAFTEELKMFFIDYSNEIKNKIVEKIKQTNLIE